MPTKKEIENLFDLAKEKFTSGSFEASIKIFDEIIELNPDKESILLAYFYRATVNSELGENDNAIIDFSKMIEINPEAQSYRNRAQAYTKIKDYKLAIHDYDKAIKIDPDQSEYYYFRGLCKSVLKDHKSARQDYVMAEELGYEYKDKAGFPLSKLISKSLNDEIKQKNKSQETGQSTYSERRKKALEMAKELGIRDITSEMEGKTSIRSIQSPIDKSDD